MTTNYMTQATDIINRINSDFGDKASEATKFIEQAILDCDYLNHARIIRCIIYLADKNIDDLNKYIKAAKEDPRDVMFWAEYVNHNEKHPVHVRDFNKPFDAF